MQENYNALAKHPGGSLKDSVDILRKSINDLYELDEDNYKMIRNLQKMLDDSERRTKRSVGSVRRSCRFAGTGIVLLGVGCLIMNKILGEHDQKIDMLDQKIMALMKDERKEQESDG